MGRQTIDAKGGREGAVREHGLGDSTTVALWLLYVDRNNAIVKSKFSALCSEFWALDSHISKKYRNFHVQSPAQSASQCKGIDLEVHPLRKFTEALLLPIDVAKATRHTSNQNATFVPV